MYLKTPDEVELMARGGSVIGSLFQELDARIKPGISTGEIDQFCDEYIVSHEGAEAAFKGLYGFPGSVCISINEEIVHGIPSFERLLAEGDIVSVDVGVKMDGWCSDSAWTFPVGEISAESQHLLSVTEAALEAAIEATVPGGFIGDIGAAVEATVDGTGFEIIRDLVGHAVGKEVHEEPQVPNRGRKGYGTPLRPGLVLAIEPMLAVGTWAIQTLEDQWTVISEDRSRSAHFEHTVAVTPEGPRILTAARSSTESPVEATPAP
jgi:methionyl aminopeptidase